MHVHEHVEILVDTWPGGPYTPSTQPRSHGARGWSGVGVVLVERLGAGCPCSRLLPRPPTLIMIAQAGAPQVMLYVCPVPATPRLATIS